MSHIIFKMSFCNFVAVFMQVIQIKSRLSHTRPAKELHFPSYALMQRLSMTLTVTLSPPCRGAGWDVQPEKLDFSHFHRKHFRGTPKHLPHIDREG